MHEFTHIYVVSQRAQHKLGIITLTIMIIGIIIIIVMIIKNNNSSNNDNNDN